MGDVFALFHQESDDCPRACGFFSVHSCDYEEVFEVGIGVGWEGDVYGESTGIANDGGLET